MTIDISKSKQTKTVFKVQSNGNLELRINRTDHSNKAKKKAPYVETVKPISESKNSAADSTTDWTDGKNDERKRYRVLPNGVVMKLMKKSDYKGFERMLTNISLIVGNAFLIKNLDILNNLTNVQTVAAFLPLYMFYGFQLQCMGFAGGHELIHCNAFKTKAYNYFFAFLVGVCCFEVPRHEKLMHKEHHIHTLNTTKDPELTSFYSKEELSNPKFKSAPSSRLSYFKSFFITFGYLKSRMCRLVSCACGELVDYSGRGWSMETDKNSFGDNIVYDLQINAILQLSAYAAIFAIFGRDVQGLFNLAFWWICPNLVGYCFINFYRNAEHAACDITSNQLLNTRTVESIAFFRWLLWNTNYHCEHHCYPMIPFFNLPKLHELMDDHIKHNECKTFASQNWNMIKKGGWIDTQKEE